MDLVISNDGMKSINLWIAVGGTGHRLKFGHSIEYLPQVVEKFGNEGVPAFFMHLLQDFTTVDGLPIVPHAWDVKDNLTISRCAQKSSDRSRINQFFKHTWRTGCNNASFRVMEI